ncbi:MAG: hypothetical protein ABI852_01960 [Gemmatimonadaceae bacterium]
MFSPHKTHHRALLTSAVTCALSVALSACYSTVRTTQDVTHNPNEYVAATRPAADCAAEIAAARLDTMYVPSNPATRSYSAHLITVAHPDFSKAPASLRGKTAIVKMQIDESGNVIPRTIRITGINDGDFTKELRDVSKSFRYFPAVRNGCAVSGWSVAQYTVGQRMTTSPEPIR